MRQLHESVVEWKRGVLAGWLRQGVAIAFVCVGAGQVGGVNLDTHEVVLDLEGKLIPWTADPARGYHEVMELSWDLLLEGMPIEPSNGLPPVYTHSEYRPATLRGSGWPNNPAGKNAMLADSARLYYAYAGDAAVVEFVEGLLDHQLEFGTTPTNAAWARVPWSTAAGGSVVYGNDAVNEGVGVLEPDKVGELGYHGYLMFYQLTGNTNYLQAALACADALALHVRDGDGLNSPWPFRVEAQTGQTAGGESYCAHVVAPIRLFDELIRLGLGDTNAYATARQKAWDWMVAHPLANNRWANYFEDVEPSGNVLNNLNSYTAGQTARYLLEHPELDEEWETHATSLLEYMEDTFGGMDQGEPGLQFGARVISEQVKYPYKMASHTARFGAVHALRFAATGDAASRETAYRSLNWATYMCRSNGVVIEGPAEFDQNSPCWFTDGHGDYVRHFMLALGAVPEWAPADENHIVRCSSVIQSVNYHTNGVQLRYETFDAAASTTMRLAFVPVLVLVEGQRLLPQPVLSEPGWTYEPNTGVLRIRHAGGRRVEVFGESASETDFAATLEDGVPASGAHGGDPDSEHFYRVTATAGVARLQFELRDCSADLTLLVSRGLPPPSLGAFDYLSAHPGTNDELVVVFPDSQPQGAAAGDWYVTVVNTSGSPADYTIQATQAGVTGHPLSLGAPGLGSNLFQLSWNSLPGARYVVSATPNLAGGSWQDASPTLTATGEWTSYAVPVREGPEFFRVREGVALDPASPAQFRLEQIWLDAGGVTLEWRAPTTLRFRVEWSSGLPPVWNSLPQVVSSTNGWFTFVDDGSATAPLGATRFYRLVQAP